MYNNLNKEYANFECERFENEVFDDGKPDPFGKRMRNIRSWADVRYHYGLSALRCDEWQLRKGYMSAPLHECLEKTLGKERLGAYFRTEAEKPRMSTKDQEIEDLANLLFGSVSDHSRIRGRRK